MGEIIFMIAWGLTLVAAVIIIALAIAVAVSVWPFMTKDMSKEIEVIKNPWERLD